MISQSNQAFEKTFAVGRYLLRAFSMNFQRHSRPFRDLGDDVNVVSPNHLPTQLYMMQLKVSRCLTRMATYVVLTYNVPTIRRDWMTVECRFAVFATFDQRIWHATGPLHLLAIWDVNRLCHPPGQIEFMILWWGPTVRNNNGKRGATVALVARCPSSYSIPFIVNKYNISFKARHPLESEESDRHERPSPTFHPICFYCERTVVRTNLITLVLSISAQKLQCKWLLYPQLHVLFAQLRGSEVIWKLLTLVNIIIVWECLCINFLRKR